MSRLKDLLNLSHVPRWCITPVLKPQSVAEHSYRVAIIATEIARQVHVDIREVVAWALVHDAPESYTGDIPSPFKHFLRDRNVNIDAPSVILCPWLDKEMPSGALIVCIVKLADSIEALSWISAYGVAEKCRYNGDRIDQQLRERIHREAAEAEKTYSVPFIYAVSSVLGEVAP